MTTFTALVVALVVCLLILVILYVAYRKFKSSDGVTRSLDAPSDGKEMVCKNGVFYNAQTTKHECIADECTSVEYAYFQNKHFRIPKAVRFCKDNYPQTVKLPSNKTNTILLSIPLKADTAWFKPKTMLNDTAAVSMLEYAIRYDDAVTDKITFEKVAQHLDKYMVDARLTASYHYGLPQFQFDCALSQPFDRAESKTYVMGLNGVIYRKEGMQYTKVVEGDETYNYLTFSIEPTIYHVKPLLQGVVKWRTYDDGTVIKWMIRNPKVPYVLRDVDTNINDNVYLYEIIAVKRETDTNTLIVQVRVDIDMAGKLSTLTFKVPQKYLDSRSVQFVKSSDDAETLEFRNLRLRFAAWPDSNNDVYISASNILANRTFVHTVMAKESDPALRQQRILPYWMTFFSFDNFTQFCNDVDEASGHKLTAQHVLTANISNNYFDMVNV